ncbi:MAG: response regulator, partial [Gammaproteobacteria bacterium]|nr:response regulator [Gammaproteobacteria bacterium]NNJ83564.1 response regulator [Gammaproteobacteria bacterium]
STFSLVLPTTQYSEAEVQQGEIAQSMRLLGPSISASNETSSAGHTEQDETGIHADFRGKSVLIVDNDIHALLAMAPQLERWGLVVAAASDAEEALDTLSEDGPFDLVLIDLDLPEKTGYEAIFRIRAQELFQNIPIVALATEYDQEDQERCLATGAVECLGKPVQPVQLKKLLARQLITI